MRDIGMFVELISLELGDIFQVVYVDRYHCYSNQNQWQNQNKSLKLIWTLIDHHDKLIFKFTAIEVSIYLKDFDDPDYNPSGQLTLIKMLSVSALEEKSIVW